MAATLPRGSVSPAEARTPLETLLLEGPLAQPRGHANQTQTKVSRWEGHSWWNTREC